MTFPGVGRAVFIAGATGDTTGRDNDWQNYDGTNDTAWQQWVDDTSSALGSSYTVSKTENNILRQGPENGYLAITDGSTQTLGYFTTDAVDPTSMQIKLNGGHAMTRPEIRQWGPTILMTSVADQGSMVLFKTNGTVDSGKISGLLPFQPTNTRHSVVAEYWHMPGVANTQYGDPDNAYSLLFMAQDPNSLTLDFHGGSNSTASNVAVIGHSVIQDPDTLFSSPSTGMTKLNASMQGEIHIDTYSGSDYYSAYTPIRAYGSGSNNFINQVQPDWTLTLDKTGESLPRIIYTGDSNFVHMRHPQYGNPPNNASEWQGIFMNWTPFKNVNGSSSSGNQLAVMWNTTFAAHVWNLNHPDNTIDQFVASAKNRVLGSGGSQDAEYNKISIQNPDRTQFIGGTDRSEAELGTDFIQAIKLDNGEYIGMYGDTSGTKGGNLYVNAVARTAEDLDANWTYRISPEYIVADDITATDTHANSSTPVSATNGSDSSSTAFDPEAAVLFKLNGSFFAVLWRQSTTAYISIFEASAQTSSPCQITRRVDTINLGTVPEGDLAGLHIGSGVALITCGNKYRFIKTDTV